MNDYEYEHEVSEQSSTNEIISVFLSSSSREPSHYYCIELNLNADDQKPKHINLSYATQ